MRRYSEALVAVTCPKSSPAEEGRSAITAYSLTRSQRLAWRSRRWNRYNGNEQLVRLVSLRSQPLQRETAQGLCYGTTPYVHSCCYLALYATSEDRDRR